MVAQQLLINKSINRSISNQNKQPARTTTIDQFMLASDHIRRTVLKVLISSGIKTMLFPEMMITALRQAEHRREVFHGAWEGPPVSCPMLPHGLNQLEHHLAVRTGALLFTGWRTVDLQVLDQGLFGVVPFTTCLAIVQEVLTATGGLMYVHHVTACQMFPTFLIYVVGLTSVHPEVPSQSL